MEWENIWNIIMLIFYLTIGSLLGSKIYDLCKDIHEMNENITNIAGYLEEANEKLEKIDHKLWSIDWDISMMKNS